MTTHQAVATIFLMPQLVGNLEFVVCRRKKLPVSGNRSTDYPLPTTNFKVKQGFTLIEVVLSIFIILAIVTIVLIASGSYTTSRNSNLQGIAAKIASREMENLRNTAYSSLPDCPGPGGCAITSTEEPDLAKLPSSSAKRTIDTYGGSADMKIATIQIDWTANGAAKQSKIETLIYKNGL